MQNSINVGDQVIRVCSDYSNGNEGTVLEIGTGAKEGKIRVHWTHNDLHRAPNRIILGIGYSKKGIKTWVAATGMRLKKDIGVIPKSSEVTA